ncbi:hypothetical protein MNBD_GAMMA22-550 [hydrothermal vent metagenome]|uniref:Flagellar protein FliL n=1 Tax=hydrothermal vent metagenome TaxID=652676 RepID=A0A3B0ZMQ1_9ZZZZ
MVEKNDVELAPVKSGASTKMLIIIGVVVVILIAASIGITLMLVSGGSDKKSTDTSEQSSSAEQSTVNSKPAVYFLLKPDFVINFESDGKANFLSVTIQLMARDSKPISVIETHMPVLRNNILLLLSAQKYDEVRTTEGKEKLRKDMLKIVKKIIDNENKAQKKNSGDDFKKIEYIEAVYFTGFIMQ